MVYQYFPFNIGFLRRWNADYNSMTKERQVLWSPLGPYPSPIMRLRNVNHHVDKVYDIFLIFQKKKKYAEAAMRSNILS